MKKIFITAGIIAAVFFLTIPMASAQTADTNLTTSTQTSGSTTVTMAVTNVEGTTDAFTYNCSPNVGIFIYAGSSAFALTSANALLGADKNNGTEYGSLSISTGYAMRDKTTNVSTGPVAPTATDALPGSGWAWMGGSGS